MAGDDNENSGRSEEDGVITAIPKDKAEDLIEVIRNGMDRRPEGETYSQNRQDYSPTPPSSSISIADELAKLAKLKEQGIISESEFVQMKQDLIRRI